MDAKELESEESKFSFTDYLEQKDEYLGWARDRVLVLDTNNFNKWMVQKRGAIVLGATAWFINSYDTDGSVYFDSAVNKDLFLINDEDYTNLLPYAIEHEVQESYLKILIKKGLMSESDTHGLAMKAEFELASQDGKQQRLYDYMLKKSPERINEYQEAYDLVK